MKMILMVALVFSLLIFPTTSTIAVPFKADNPQIVANFPTGDHGVVGENSLHQGADVVKQNGQSGNFQQWFFGTSAENGGITEGDHSVWKLAKNGVCSVGWDLVPNASANWGGYLQAGDYCVHTNDFHSH